MTTRLAGPATKFLPFDLGNEGGAGNPLNPTGHATAYLWEEVWARDSWLEILGRYIVAQRDSKKKIAAIIFPRYHQLDATRRLVATVREEGPGGKYLVQHSTGSGKTNSIAWTAHFLADLHDDKNAKLYDSVLVVSEVPSHWQTCALKRVVSLKSGDTIRPDEIADEGEYPVFGGNGQRGYTDAYTHEGLFPLIGRQGALCGNINYASGKFWASEHAVVVSQITPVQIKWLGELLRSMNLGQYSVSAAQPGLSVEILNSLRIPLPPPLEQLDIAAFLDRETGKIAYAADHSLEIVRVYSDEGISGLQIKNRAGLKSMLDDVVRGNPGFGTVLVYDISRWGRFQDIDQSAFLEFQCRMNGVDVVYCAEPFQNDHGAVSAIVKSLRRVEAANFSRDLSVKVFKGQCNLASRGYVQGGHARYGLRHVLVRDDGMRRFGSLFNAYRMIGYDWTSKSAHWKERVRRRQLRARLLEELRQVLNKMGFAVRIGATSARFWIAEMPCYFQLSTRSTSRRGRAQWVVDLKSGPSVAFRLLGRLGRDGKSIMDFYLVPHAAIPNMPWAFNFKSADGIDVYRVKDLLTVAQRLVASLTKAPRAHGIMVSQIAR